jgi:SAM-dependent methyltransferase
LPAFLFSDSMRILRAADHRRSAIEGPIMVDDWTTRAVACFDRHAPGYAGKYFGLRDYDRPLDRLLARLPPQARVLDVACGPAGASAYLLARRPDLRIIGLDRAPGMLAEARARVPAARFVQRDCSDLAGLGAPFDGALQLFLLSYLDDGQAEASLAALHAVLGDDAPLLLATISGRRDEARIVTSSAGDELRMHFRTPERIHALLAAAGFRIDWSEPIASPASASQATEDLIVLARRQAPPI